MRRTMILTAMVLAAGLIGCDKGDKVDKEQAAATQPDAEHGLPGDPVAGAAVYARICVACHAADGRGNGGVTGGDFIADKSRLAKTNTELLRSINEGILDKSPPMPAQKDALSEEEIRNALAYVRKNFGGTTQ